MLLAH